MPTSMLPEPVMSSSSNADHFFQTTSSLEEINRRAAKSYNTNGDPIKLPSKILAITADATNNGSVYVAESAGTIKRVGVETGRVSAIYRGPTVPLTSICLSPDGNVIFAGCWDKTIWSWDAATREPKMKYKGHTDFVKTVICAKLGDRDYLISGGADADIIVWDVSTGRRLHVIKGHTRAIQDLVLDPTFLQNESRTTLDEATIFSAGSERDIRSFCLSSDVTKTALAEPIIQHETTVYKLFFDGDGDLWTASADKTAKCLARERGWKADTVLDHPDFVRDVVVHEQGGWVITACWDEEVRVWNRSTGELYHTFSGHFEEVTGLLLVGWTVASVSIDATIRRWSLKPDDLQKAKLEALNDVAKVAPEKEPVKESMLTEDEERELAELMEED